MNPVKLKNSWLLFRCINRISNQLEATFTLHTTCSKSFETKEQKDKINIDSTNMYSVKKQSTQKESYSKYKSNRDSSVRDFIFSNKNNPDSFGCLASDWKMHEQLKNMPDEEDDMIETEFLLNKENKQRLSNNQYARIIKKFLQENKIGLALDVLETRILKEDRGKPDSYVYNLLIGACGRVGYTKKAFSLYNQMKKRGLKPTGHTYTALFNACANSPFPEDDLKRAMHLRNILLEKAVLMNTTIYHAMIKAFGRCGDIETAFTLVDEMMDNRMRLSIDTFCFLMQASITDKTSGFRHALLVWRKMINKTVRPNLYMFNLLLRCSRDCGLGEDVPTKQVVQLVLDAGQKSAERLGIAEGSVSTETRVSLSTSDMRGKTSGSKLPNLISRSPTLGDVTDVNSVSLPEHRLMLLGGISGILKEMDFYNVKPDIKTFTQLLDLLPSRLADEQELLDAVKKYGVPLDIDFCNLIIRKRSMRGNYEDAKSMLKIISKENLRPNIMTFGVLAITCKTFSTAKQFLQEINNFGFRPNIEILGTLLKNGCYARDSDFVLYIINTLEKEEITVNEVFLKHLEKFYNFATTALNNKTYDGLRNQDKFRKFCKFYESRGKDMTLEPLPHPWQQFQEPNSDSKDKELMNTGRVAYAK